MTDCNQTTASVSTLQRAPVEARFSGGDITSYGGVLLLRQADRAVGLTERVAKALRDLAPQGQLPA